MFQVIWLLQIASRNAIFDIMECHMAITKSFQGIVLSTNSEFVGLVVGYRERGGGGREWGSEGGEGRREGGMEGWRGEVVGE